MTKRTQILIVGNGFGGVYALKNLHKFFHDEKKGSGVEFTLIGEKNYFLFTPLLHEVATGGINPSNIIEPIRKVLGCCLDNFYLGKAETVDTKNKIVKTSCGSISYDYLILAPGSESNFYNIPGAEEYSFTLKSIEDAIKIKNHCIQEMERASRIEDRVTRKNMLNFVVVGGGPTGVELVAEMEEFIQETFSLYYKKEVIEDVTVTLIQKGNALVPQFSEKIRQKSLAVLRKKGITVRLQSNVLEITPTFIILDHEEKIFTESVFWVAGIKPAVIKFEGEVNPLPDGRLTVNSYLQLTHHPEIFPIGDIAFFTQKNGGQPVPALAQAAEKESYMAAKNIAHLIRGEKLEEFIYKSRGNLLSLGQWMAAGEMFNFSFSGPITWWIWRTVYLSKLISWRKKIRVAVDWTMNIFSARDISQL